MLRTSRSVGCCGITEIYNLDDYHGAAFGERREAATIPFVLTGHKAGIALATTSDVDNYKESIRHLKSNGFYEVLTTPNPKTGHTITLWVRDLSQGKKPVRLKQKRWWLLRFWNFSGYVRRLLRRWNAVGKGPYVDNSILHENEE